MVTAAEQAALAARARESGKPVATLAYELMVKGLRLLARANRPD